MKAAPYWVTLVLLLLCAIVTAPFVLAHESEEVDYTHDHSQDHFHDDDDDVAMRCRFCGAKVASKKDYMALYDTSKAVSSKREAILGEDGELHTFINPNRMEMEIAAFKRSLGLESESFTNQATFFDNYNWRDIRCSSCKRHIGWKFHHDDLQQCINTKVMETISAKAQEKLIASASERDRKAEIVRNELAGACVKANAGWWTYQICYESEVRQYHEEADGTRSSDWSMGVFVPEEQTADTPDMGTNIVQYYAGGQHCDENGELRNSRVLYTCCKTKPKTVTVDKVDEPSLCSYIITVCVPGLCEDEKNEYVSEDAKEILDACENEFIATHEGSNIPSSFTTLRWSTVISEDSSELDWARNMQFKA